MSRKDHCSSVWINWVSHEGSASIGETELVIAYQLFSTLWTIAFQVPLSTGFSRQEYWSGLPFPSPEDIPDPEIEPECPALQADSLPTEPWGKP